MENYYYGFRQLMEIAIKALSPGVNDPGTAVLALQALAALLAYKLEYFAETTFKAKEGTVRLITKEKIFKEAFEEYFYPIWDYGKNDRLVQSEMLHILTQLKMKGSEPALEKLYHTVKTSTVDAK